MAKIKGRNFTAILNNDNMGIEPYIFTMEDGSEEILKVKQKSFLALSQSSYLTDIIGFLKTEYIDTPGIASLKPDSTDSAEFVQKLTLSEDELGHELRVKYLTLMFKDTNEDRINSLCENMVVEENMTKEDIVIALYVDFLTELGKLMNTK